MDTVEYLEELIRFDSVSAKSNVDVTDWVETQLAELGFATEQVRFTDPDGVPKSNVIGKMGPGKGGMAYFGHTDVVPADEWFTDEHGPFEPTIKGGKLYGRGSCDMKGSVACMLAAAARVSESELAHPLYVTCTADEEVGYRGASRVASHSELYREMVAGQSNAVIGEPTLLEVVYAHKGTVGFVATSHGKAAHSSTSEGLNANLAMIPFLVEMKTIHDETESDPAWQNDEFDPPTVSWNIGINDHTHAINIKPPQSVCTVYFRPMPGQDPELLLSRVQVAAEANGIELSVRKQAPPLYVDPNSPFVKEVLELAGRATPRTVAYGTDGAVFTELEKRVVYGPGSIAQAHTHDEFIELSQLEAGTRAYETLIRRWCC